MIKIERSNYRVIAEPAFVSIAGEMRACEDIVEEIKRHVDNVSCLEIKYDEKEVCEYCGYEREVNLNSDDPDWLMGQPVCCTKAEQEWKYLNFIEA